MTLILPGGSAGDYKVSLVKLGYGRAIPATATTNDFKYIISISGISPTTGSIYGGTILTITGENFSPVMS